MKKRPRISVIVPILLAGHFLAVNEYGQSTPTNPAGFHCSPAPCVLPPTQASEGGWPTFTFFVKVWAMRSVVTD
jgi:hypothetical protein